MAIAFDAVSTGMNATDPTSLTWSHTCTGDNRVLIVATSTESDTGGHTAQTVSGITYGKISTPETIISGQRTVDESSTTTGSATYTINRLYIMSVVSRTEITADPNQPTISGGGVTWTVPTNGSVVIDNSSSSRRRLTVFYGICTSTTTGTLTIDFGGQTQTNSAWAVDEVARGFDSTTPIVQATNAREVAGFVTSISTTLSAFGSSNNATYGVFGVSNGTTNPTPGTGFATVSSSRESVENGCGLETEFRSDNDTTVDWSFSSDTELGVIGLEIKAKNSLQTLTKIRTDYITDNGTELWYLIAPATGDNNIVVTMTAVVDGLFGAGLSFTGVDQTNPIDNNAGTTTTGTSISQSITTNVADAMIVNIMQHYNSAAVLTPDANQIQRFNTPTTGDNDQAGGTRLVTTAGSYTTTWTTDINDGMTLSVVSLKPSGITTVVKDLIGGGFIPFAR